jgi:uncharacterized protein YdeI (BOF family)
MLAAGGSRNRAGAMKPPAMRAASAVLILILIATGCRPSSGTVLGKITDGEVRSIQSVKADGTSAPVVLQGMMIEKCPVAGCWFRLQDGTSVVKVDTKSAGFVVVDVPLKTRMTVAGKIVRNGSEVEIEATGIRY